MAFCKTIPYIPCVSPNGVLTLFDTGSIPFSIIIEISELLMPQQLGAGKMCTAKIIMTTFETWGQRALPVTAQAPVSLLLRQHSQCIIFLDTLRCEQVISKSYPGGLLNRQTPPAESTSTFNESGLKYLLLFSRLYLWILEVLFRLIWI